MSAASVPGDAMQAARMLTGIVIPGPIVDVLRVLQKAGHEAVLVGGAVRDALLGHPRGDWDVATSATPQEVMSSFKRTIPTGIDHGTVTVLVGRGDHREPVEVTSFRGEGVYHDGRRPSEVRFHRDLHQDLARRDFTVNAFAWDPIQRRFDDCQSGLQDLKTRTIRAVGDPLARFREDGLRTMRAVRFCATLGFSLEPETAAAIPRALDVLAKVSAERVRVELWKLLEAVRPSRGLEPMVTTGIWPCVLPELQPAERAEAILAVDAMTCDAVVRLARLLRPVAKERGLQAVDVALEGLRTSRADKMRVLALVGPATTAIASATTAPEVRRAAARLGRAYLEHAMEVLELSSAERDRIREACRGAALDIKDLAVTGGDLIAAGIERPGPTLGALLEALLQWTMEEPPRNRRESLLAEARRRTTP